MKSFWEKNELQFLIIFLTVLKIPFKWIKKFWKEYDFFIGLLIFIIISIIIKFSLYEKTTPTFIYVVLFSLFTVTVFYVELESKKFKSPTILQFFLGLIFGLLFALMLGVNYQKTLELITIFSFLGISVRFWIEIFFR